MIAARETCHRLGLPHVTLDLREEFRRKVVAAVHGGLRARRDAEPVHPLQRRFRFDELLAFAERIGAARLATGHYARIVERDGRLAIARAADPAKDQSYMLATIDPSVLDRLWFPLGEQTKDETRAQAEAAGLAVARRPESQEACFLGGDDYRSFLGRSGLETTPGPLVDESGAEVGTHDGFWRFTPGQRRGLGIAASEPLYAVATEPRTNTVVVGPQRRRSRDAASRCAAGSTAGHRASRRSSATARRRSTPPSSRPAGGFELLLDEPAFGVAPGQTAVRLRGRRDRRRRRHRRLR